MERAADVAGLGFGVWGLGFREPGMWSVQQMLQVWGLGFRVWGAGHVECAADGAGWLVPFCVGIWRRAFVFRVSSVQCWYEGCV